MELSAAYSLHSHNQLLYSLEQKCMKEASLLPQEMKEMNYVIHSKVDEDNHTDVRNIHIQVSTCRFP